MLAIAENEPGALAANVLHFARLLRRAGLPVGPAEVIAAQQALLLVDVGAKAQVRAALRGLMCHRHENQEVFDQAFALFWRNPEAARQAAVLAMLDGRAPQPQKPTPGSRRVAEAMSPRQPAQREQDAPPQLDAAMTVSEREHLQAMDFEAMGAAQIAAAKAEIARLALPLDHFRKLPRLQTHRPPPLTRYPLPPQPVEFLRLRNTPEDA